MQINFYLKNFENYEKQKHRKRSIIFFKNFECLSEIFLSLALQWKGKIPRLIQKCSLLFWSGMQIPFVVASSNKHEP